MDCERREPKITPEMEEMGGRILEDAFDASPWTARSFAREVFTAMSALANSSQEEA